MGAGGGLPQAQSRRDKCGCSLSSMKTLAEIITSHRCRKGAAVAISPRGAFWRPADPVDINRTGGDGIGNNASCVRMKLEVRHYRGGLVEAVVRIESWHQNTGDKVRVVLNSDIREVLQAKTAEDVIAALMGLGDDQCGPFLGSGYESILTSWLGDLGLPACLPSPDEEAATNGGTK